MPTLSPIFFDTQNNSLVLNVMHEQEKGDIKIDFSSLDGNKVNSSNFLLFSAQNIKWCQHISNMELYIQRSPKSQRQNCCYRG